MSYVPFSPPEPEFDDTILAFRVLGGPRVAALIEPDPLGPVNKIVTLMVGQRRIKSALCPVQAGARVTVGKDPGSFYPWLSGPGWRAACGTPPLEDPPAPKPPSWYIEVNGRRVLDVPEHETWQPITPPKIPWRTRIRDATNRRTRAVADAIAARLGYHRDGECDGDDW